MDNVVDANDFSKEPPDLEVKQISIVYVAAEYASSLFATITDLPMSSNFFVMLNPPPTQKKSMSAPVVELAYGSTARKFGIVRTQTVQFGVRVLHMADRCRTR